MTTTDQILQLERGALDSLFGLVGEPAARVDVRQQPFAVLDERHLRADPREELRELAADGPATEYEQCPGHFRRLGCFPVRPIVEPLDDRGYSRRRTGCDHELVVRKLASVDADDARVTLEQMHAIYAKNIPAGRIGTPDDIYHRPKTRFVADFVGSANLIAGRVVGAAGGNGQIRFEGTGGLMLDAWASHRPRGNEDTVAVRTAHIGISVNGAPPTQANSAAGRIRQRLFHGDFIQYVVDWPAGQLIVRRPPTDLFAEGAAVTLSFAAEHCVLLEG